MKNPKDTAVDNQFDAIWEDLLLDSSGLDPAAYYFHDLGLQFLDDSQNVPMFIRSRKALEAFVSKLSLEANLSLNIVDFGPGNFLNSRLVVNHFSRGKIKYCGVEISQSILNKVTNEKNGAKSEVQRAIEGNNGVFELIQGDFMLNSSYESHINVSNPTLYCLLGGTIGQIDYMKFLNLMSQRLRPSDHLLIEFQIIEEEPLTEMAFSIAMLSQKSELLKPLLWIGFSETDFKIEVSRDQSIDGTLTYSIYAIPLKELVLEKNGNKLILNDRVLLDGHTKFSDKAIKSFSQIGLEIVEKCLCTIEEAKSRSRRIMQVLFRA